MMFIYKCSIKFSKKQGSPGFFSEKLSRRGAHGAMRGERAESTRTATDRHGLTRTNTDQHGHLHKTEKCAVPCAERSCPSVFVRVCPCYLRSQYRGCAPCAPPACRDRARLLANVHFGFAADMRVCRICLLFISHLFRAPKVRENISHLCRLRLYRAARAVLHSSPTEP